MELLLLAVYFVSILDLGVSSCSNSMVVSDGKLSSTDSMCATLRLSVGLGFV